MARNRIIPTKKRIDEVDNLIRKYNQKVMRLEKKQSPDIIVPERLTDDTRRDIIRSRNAREYNQKIRELSSFLKKGSEQKVTYQNVELPKFKASIIKRYQNKLRKETNEKIKFFEENRITTAGIEDINLIAELQDTTYQNAITKKEKLLDEIKLDEMNLDEIEEYIIKLRNNIRGLSPTKWQNTYVDILEETGNLYGIDKNIINKITEKLKNIKAEDFNKLYYQEKLIRDIMYRYKNVKNIRNLDDEETQVNEIFETLANNIDTIIKDYV